MPLTDQQITDNFDILVQTYLKNAGGSDTSYATERLNGYVIFTSWSSKDVKPPTYDDLRSSCLETIRDVSNTTNYLAKSCPIVRKTLFKSLYKIFTEIGLMSSAEVHAYLVETSGLSLEVIQSILQ